MALLMRKSVAHAAPCTQRTSSSTRCCKVLAKQSHRDDVRPIEVNVAVKKAGLLASAAAASAVLVLSTTSFVPPVAAAGVTATAEDGAPRGRAPEGTGPFGGEYRQVDPPGHAIDPERATALQKHVMYWDFDKDGVIYPGDTFKGFRQVGFNRIVSALSTMVIHSSFSWASGGFPDFAFPIYIENMNRTNHGSDTQVYNPEGEINHESADRILKKYDPQGRGGLYWEDIQRMVADNRNVNDVFGWTADQLEWWAFHVIAHDDNGFVSKEKIMAQYDGSLWELLAKEREGKNFSRP